MIKKRHIISACILLMLILGCALIPAQVAHADKAQGSHPLSNARGPQWGITPGRTYSCCYTGKGEDVLFIHGVDGTGLGADGNDPNGNCQVNFGAAMNLLSDSMHQWVGNLVVLHYYNHDHCTIDSNKTPNASYFDIHNAPHAYYCNGYNDGNVGTNNENDLHLACVLAWYIWDNYTVNTWTVNVVAHSLGGVLLKEALYQINVNHDSHFPAYLFLDHVVTLDSPLLGIPIGGDVACGFCTQLHQLVWGVAGGIWGDLNSSAGKAVQGLSGTTWIMEGEASIQCDHVGDSAFGMSYGTKVDYRFAVSNISSLPDACSPNNDGNYYYGHGTFLQDNQTTDNVEVAYCVNCAGDPPISNPLFSFHHSLQEMFWGLAGDCSASPSTNNCDGDDPSVTHCTDTKTIPGGDPWYLTVYWSTGCSTNWALVSAPSGYLVTVTIARSSTKSWNNVDRHFVYCAPALTSCPADTWAQFGPTTTSWITDMLYAPTEAVAVTITTTTGATYTSIWH